MHGSCSIKNTCIRKNTKNQCFVCLGRGREKTEKYEGKEILVPPQVAVSCPESVA